MRGQQRAAAGGSVHCTFLEPASTAITLFPFSFVHYLCRQSYICLILCMLRWERITGEKEASLGHIQYGIGMGLFLVKLHSLLL